MKTTNLFQSRRDIRRVQAGWALILLSALTALGVASMLTAAGAGDGVGLAAGLILGAVPLITGELWLSRTATTAPRRPAAPRTTSNDAGTGAMRVVVEDAHMVQEIQEARPGGIIWVSPFARDGASGHQHGGTYLHERLDTPR